MSPSVLNTFEGGSSSLQTTPLFFLLGMDLGHVSGEPALERSYSSKVSKAPWSCGLGSCLFLLCHPEWRVATAAAHPGGILGCNWRKNLRKQSLCSVLRGEQAVVALGLGAHRRQPFKCFYLLLPI